MRINIICSIIFLAISFSGCVAIDNGDRVNNEIIIITDVITGSVEYPDPIEKKIREFEKEGILKDVIIMESSPAQFLVTGQKCVIEELKKMSRKGLRR